MESWLKPDDGACACYFVSTTCDKATTCNLLRTHMVRLKAYLQFCSPQTHLYIGRNTFVLLAWGYERMREWTHVISCNFAIGSDICSPGSQVHRGKHSLVSIPTSNESQISHCSKTCVMVDYGVAILLFTLLEAQIIIKPRCALHLCVCRFRGSFFGNYLRSLKGLSLVFCSLVSLCLAIWSDSW